jgi:hypothetical protein
MCDTQVPIRQSRTICCQSGKKTVFYDTIAVKLTVVTPTNPQMRICRAAKLRICWKKFKFSRNKSVLSVFLYWLEWQLLVNPAK